MCFNRCSKKTLVEKDPQSCFGKPQTEKCGECRRGGGANPSVPLAPHRSTRATCSNRHVRYLFHSFLFVYRASGEWRNWLEWREWLEWRQWCKRCEWRGRLQLRQWISLFQSFHSPYPFLSFLLPKSAARAARMAHAGEGREWRILPYQCCLCCVRSSWLGTAFSFQTFCMDHDHKTA